MQRFKHLLPHLVVFILFIIVALSYFSPVLQGKKIYQSDIAQYIGMSKQQKDFQKETGEETYWTDAAFGGMPTYQLGAKYPHNYIKKLDLSLRFLPRPADYLFLYLIGMYILLLVLKVDYKLAVIGALAFGFSTYLIIILGVGHNAKAHAIAYMPLVLSGILLTFQKKYLYGFLLTTIAMALELVANHFQMTYYLLLLVLIIGIVYLIDAFKNKSLAEYFKAIAILVVGVILAIGLNATNILATKEYAAASTRGKTDLTIKPDGSPKEVLSGLDYDYITEYSYGKLESFNLFIPRFMGGGSSEPITTDSNTFDSLLKLGASPQEASQILNQIPMYWGDQPIVAAPAYIGAVILFLAVLALFLVNGKIKRWIVAAFLLSLFLSWGKNFSLLTDFFIEYVPLYNKFRAVSSIQVIIELIIPILAIIGLHHFFTKSNEQEKRKSLLIATAISGGLAVLFLLFKSSLFSFVSPYDSYFIQELGLPFIDAVREDRMAIFTSDTIRSLILVLLTAATLWFLISKKIKQNAAIGIIVILILFDLVGVDRRYVNNDNFNLARLVDHPFQANAADTQVLADDEYYRVFDAIVGNPFASGRASYFHNALGGYHAAKPGRIQDLDDFYLSKGHVGILNMMNVRYILTQSNNGATIAQRNPYANGAAWYVESVLFANNANEEIQFLDSLDTKKTAIVTNEFRKLLPLEDIERDSTATIELISQNPSHKVYQTTTSSNQLAVFSEIYYPQGWNAYIDDKPAEYIRANYVLRAMQIPEGSHKIEFKFEPKVIKTGSMIALGSSILFLGLFFGGIFYQRRKGSHVDNDSINK